MLILCCIHNHTTPQHTLLYSCPSIIYSIVYLYSYHIHINFSCHVCASSLSSYLFSLPISLLIFLLSHNHACSQLLHSLILVCYSVMSIDAINFIQMLIVYFMTLFWKPWHFKNCMVEPFCVGSQWEWQKNLQSDPVAWGAGGRMADIKCL